MNLKPSVPTQKEIDALVAAMDQLLDDMGTEGCCVCPAGKAQARVAFEPFITAEHAREYYMPLFVAQLILSEQ